MTDLHVPNSEHCFHILGQTPATLRSVLEPVTREQMDWRPSAERWSISMVLAHLAEVEVKGFRSRFEAMLGADRPLLRSYDQLALFRSPLEFDGRAELDRFEEERKRTLALLHKMPEAAGDRPGQHEELGTLTVAQLLNEHAFHDLGHLRQILELYRAHVFYPQMGVYQSFYQVNP